MTKSPLAVTLIPLLPLAALGWPLAKVLNQKAYQPVVTTAEVTTGPLVTADLYVTSAHPFESINVSIGEATWTFAPDDEVKEIHYPAGSEIILTTAIVWSSNTPESAVKITLEPQGQLGQSHTLWGQDEVSEEIKFIWEDES